MLFRSKEEVLEKRFKDTQRKLTEIATEKAELERRLARLEGANEVLSRSERREEPPENPFKFLDDEDQDLLDDPKNVKSLLKKTIGALAEVLEVRDRALSSRLMGEIDARDPTVREVREKISELKRDPDYEGVPDKVLAIIAKKSLVQKKPEGDEEGDSDNLRGGIGGGRRTVRRKSDPVDAAADKLMKDMGYDRYD